MSAHTLSCPSPERLSRAVTVPLLLWTGPRRVGTIWPQSRMKVEATASKHHAIGCAQKKIERAQERCAGLRLRR